VSFNPDTYADEEELPKKKDEVFNPDTYADEVERDQMDDSANALGTMVQQWGNTALLGYAPHLGAAVDPLVNYVGNLFAEPDIPLSGDYVQRRDENLKNYAQNEKENPNAAFLGKALGFVNMLGVPMGKAGQAKTVLGGVGQGAKIGALTAGLSNPGDELGKVDPLQLKARAGNAAIGGAIGAAIPAAVATGHYVLKGGSAGVVNPPETIPEKVLMEMEGQVGEPGAAIPVNPSVEAAAKNLDVEATPGMLSDDYITKGLEASLSKAPSGAGNAVRNVVNKARGGIMRAAKNIIGQSSDNSDLELGEAMVEGIKAKIRERYKPIQEMYDKLHGHTSKIPVREASRLQIVGNMRRYAAENFLEGDPQHSLVMKMADQIENAHNVAQLDQAKTKLRNAINAMDPRLRAGFGPLFDKLNRLKETSVLRAAVENAATPQEGLALGKDLLAQRKVANKMYGDLMDLIGQVSKKGRLGKGRTVGEFVDHLDDLLDNGGAEEVGKKLFTLNNVKFAERLSKEFPEVFQLLRTHKMGQMLEASHTDGVFSPYKFITQLDKLRPEIRQLLLGAENNAKVSDLKTLVRAMPVHPNPSGTSINQAYQELWSPAQQARDWVNFGVYKSGILPKAINGTAAATKKIGGTVGYLASRPLNMSPVPMVEGYSVNDVQGVDPMQRSYYAGLIAQNQEIDNVEKAKLLNLLNKHGVLPREYVGGM
jgi:hypothetical protein